MPTFTSEPPRLPDGYVFRVVRTPATACFTAVVTSLEVVGTQTHFANNRTTPCDGIDQCALCTDGFSRRWHGYVSCVATPTLEHVLFEFTAHASDTFRNYHDLHGTMRACQFRAFRPSKRNNGRVVIHTAPGDESRMRLPEPPNIAKLLCHLWNVQYNPEQPTRMNRPPFKTVGLGGNGQTKPQDRTPTPAESTNGLRTPTQPLQPPGLRHLG